MGKQTQAVKAQQSSSHKRMPQVPVKVAQSQAPSKQQSAKPNQKKKAVEEVAVEMDEFDEDEDEDFEIDIDAAMDGDSDFDSDDVDDDVELADEDEEIEESEVEDLQMSAKKLQANANGDKSTKSKKANGNADHASTPLQKNKNSKKEKAPEKVTKTSSTEKASKSSKSVAPSSTSVAESTLHLNPQIAKDSVYSLYTYLAARADKQTNRSLFVTNDYIYIQIAVTRAIVDANEKPLRLPLKHSLYSGDETEICLITKDPHSLYKENFKQLMSTSKDTGNLSNITKIVGLKKLRSHYRQYKDRRELLARFDLFLADDRVLPLLPPVLGKKFFEKKRQPLPVDLTHRNSFADVENALQATSIVLTTGNAFQCRIGRTSFSRQQVVDNLIQVVEQISAKVPGGKDNIQAIYIKTSDSIALPVYAHLPSLKRSRSEDEDVEEDDAPPRPVVNSKKVKKSKPVTSSTAESEQPKSKRDLHPQTKAKEVEPLKTNGGTEKKSNTRKRK